MMVNLYTRKVKYILLLFLLTIVFSNRAKADVENDSPFILFVSSYNPETSQTSRNISAFLDEYQRIGGEATSVIIENMNCKSFSEANLWKGQFEAILNKYISIGKSPELIIILGQEAWSSYLSVDDKITGNIPVICGMVSRNVIILPEDTVALKSWEPESLDAFLSTKSENIVAGYAYEYDIKRNIELIERFFPETKNIAFISDNTYGGVSMQSLVRKEMKKFSHLNLIPLDGRKHSIYTIVSDISALPERTAILIGTWRVDTNEGYFMQNATYAMKDANPMIPAFTVASIGLGYWVIGGYIPEYMTIGNKIAHQAKSYLDGHKKNNIQIELIPNKYIFDINKLAQNKISLKQLPPDSTLVNRQETFWDKYRVHFFIVFSIFVFVLIGFFVSLFYYIRTKKLKDDLEKSEEKLRVSKDKAEESNQLKSAFIANMSHEIRTPLNAIIGFSDLLISQDATDEQKAYFEVIQSNTDLLLHLINDILDISRLESGRMKFIYEDYDVIGLCNSAIVTAEHARRTAAEYIFESSIEEYTLKTDVQRLHQVLNNLLSNAGKFTETGKIILKCELNEAEQMFYFSVSDTGIGIPREKQKQVFERFEKLNEFVQGTGLGLSITKLIIERLGGGIWVDPDYTDGARFVFTHPVYVNENNIDD